MTKETSKRFLDSIINIKTTLSRRKKSLNLHPGMLITMKIIYNDYVANKNNEYYYGVKTSQITKDLCITKPATSKMLNIMEEKGYVERISNKSDRRVVYVKLTTEGEDFLKKENMKFEMLTHSLVDKMGEEDMKSLINLLNKLSNVMDELEL